MQKPTSELIAELPCVMDIKLSLDALLERCPMLADVIADDEAEYCAEVR